MYDPYSSGDSTQHSVIALTSRRHRTVGDPQRHRWPSVNSTRCTARRSVVLHQKVAAGDRRLIAPGCNFCFKAKF
jgi:hypothetical protein